MIGNTNVSSWTILASCAEISFGTCQIIWSGLSSTSLLNKKEDEYTQTNIQHINVERLTTPEFWDQLEATVDRPRNITYGRYLLITRKQKNGESVQQFNLALK